MKNNYLDLLKTSIFAGIAISIGCLAFLTMGAIIGPILFTFGLITVVHYKLSLYTGSVGFVDLLGTTKSHKENWQRILIIIFGNMVGCLIVALLATQGNFTFALNATAIINSRLSQSLLAVLVRGIGCGLIMTTAVQFAREGKFLPLLFGVPLFIYCGFYHSIADTFYYIFGISDKLTYLMSNINIALRMMLYLGITYVGNYFGCSAYKLFVSDK